MTVAVLGAGLLGSGFVENLLGKGHTVRVWNRTAAKLAPLAALGATITTSPADAVAGADRVHLVLSEDDAVDSVIAAARPALGAGVPIFDHSTNLPVRVATRFAALWAEGIAYFHCPVFMGPANSKAATGIMLAAGPTDALNVHVPTLQTMTGKVWVVGERPDLAAVYKLLGNSLIISLAGVMGDTLAIGRAEGLDGAAVNELFKNFNPAGMLPIMADRIARSETGDASFTLEMARKDVRLMMETARSPLNVLPGVAAAMDAAIADGKSGKDFAVFVNRG